MVSEMKKRGLEPCEVRFLADDMLGAASGGTIASVVNIFESYPTSKLVELANPFYLAPRGEDYKPIQATDSSIITAGSDNMVVGYDKILKRYTMPWIMQGIDTRVVNRSNALSGWAYGRNFLYSERMIAPSLFSAIISMILMPLGSALLFFPFTRNIVKKFLPKPGEGPNEEILKNGFFKIKLWGRGKNSDGKEEIIQGGIVALNGDPGYAQTAKLISEAAVCLLQEISTSTSKVSGGVLTPSTAMGNQLREKLNTKGIQFFVQ